MRCFLIFVFPALAMSVLTGCHMSVSAGLGNKRASVSASHDKAASPETIQSPAAQARPPIEGDWSEPVNGVQMSARIVEPADGHPAKDLRLLLVAWNTTDEPVDLPSLHPEQAVRAPALPGDEMPAMGRYMNLRVVAEPLGHAQDHSQVLHGLDQLREMERQLEPGEVRIYILRLRIIRQLEQEMQQAVRQRRGFVVPEHTMDWHHPASGTYRLHLTYRPEGFGIPSDQKAVDMELDLGAWEGKQIQLSPIEHEIYPDH